MSVRSSSGEVTVELTIRNSLLASSHTGQAPPLENDPKITWEERWANSSPQWLYVLGVPWGLGF